MEFLIDELCECIKTHHGCAECPLFNKDIGECDKWLWLNTLSDDE